MGILPKESGRYYSPHGRVDELPEFHERPFTCPHCGKETRVVTPMKFIFAKRTYCDNCGEEFLIENDQPKRLAN
jgi:transcription elongation factor Elf1